MCGLCYDVRRSVTHNKKGCVMLKNRSFCVFALSCCFLFSAASLGAMETGNKGPEYGRDRVEPEDARQLLAALRPTMPSEKAWLCQVNFF